WIGNSSTPGSMIRDESSVRHSLKRNVHPRPDERGRSRHREYGNDPHLLMQRAQLILRPPLPLVLEFPQVVQVGTVYSRTSITTTKRHSFSRIGSVTAEWIAEASSLQGHGVRVKSAQRCS